MGSISVASGVFLQFIFIYAAASFALEPPDMKRITDEDKLYFAGRIDKEQVEKIRHIIDHSILTNKQPCDKVAAITNTVKFIKTVKPIFREASKSADISSHARRYSADLVQELSGTSKAMVELLPYYRGSCTSSGDK